VHEAKNALNFIAQLCN